MWGKLIIGKTLQLARLELPTSGTEVKCRYHLVTTDATHEGTNIVTM